MTLSRRNLIDTKAEAFKPPLFKPNTSVQNRLENWLRNFIDIQGGSARRDLRLELAKVRGSLLDVGCGAQVFRNLIPSDVTYRGIDTIDAKAQFGYEIPDTHYFEGDDWGVEEGTFHTALCTEVLEHIQDPPSFLGRIYTCLRPGGRLIMTVPFAARWHFIPYDYWRFTPSSLNILLTNAGFDSVRIQARGNPLTVACYKAMALHLLLLLGHKASLARRVLGIVLLPIFGLLACVANLSLAFDWGDDCLGYTITARRPLGSDAPNVTVTNSSARFGRATEDWTAANAEEKNAVLVE
jgi:SAM-dependent methyltransferase